MKLIPPQRLITQSLLSLIFLIVTFLPSAPTTATPSPYAQKTAVYDDAPPQRFFGNNPPPVQQYFVPMPETAIVDALTTLYPTAQSPIYSFVSLAVGRSGTDLQVIIYYDHHEDGYEADISNPTQATTEIWGDGDPSNGYPPPPYGTSADIVRTGDVLLLKNDIDINNPSPTPLFDGGDTFAATMPLAVTRGAWPVNDPGAKIAGAVEVYEDRHFGTEFLLPFGPEIASNEMFEFVSLFLMARNDNTQIQVDTNNDGTPEQTINLNKGDTHYIAQGPDSPSTLLQVGTRITSNQPIQANTITGDQGATFEARWYSLLPVEFWGHSYYSPVGTPNFNINPGPTDIFLYNPHNTPLTVSWETRTNGQPAITIPADSVARQPITVDSGLHFFTTDERPFYAVATVDSDSIESEIFDWGFPLLPERALNSSALVGWGISNLDIACHNLGEDQPASPVWVTTVAPATLYVDYDGDPTTGARTDPNGNHYDVDYAMTTLESRTIFDPTDYDQTGMMLYALDGTNPVNIIVAWGQNPILGTFDSLCNLDLGTVVWPLPTFTAAKEVTSYIDQDNNGELSIGDILTYLITVEQVGPATLPSVVVSDALPQYTSYVPNSTFVYVPDMTAVPDDTSGTPYPLDNDGILLGDIPVGAVYQVSFQVLLEGPLPSGAGEIYNQAVVRALGEERRPDVTVPVSAAPDLLILKDDGGVGVIPGQSVTYQLTYDNIGTQDATGVTITDEVPNHTTFDPDNSTPGWNCTPDYNPGAVCTIFIGDVNVADPIGSVDFAVIADIPFPANYILNETHIQDDGQNGADLNPDNNYDYDTTPVPDFTLDKSYSLVTDNDNDGLVDAGDIIAFDITVTQEGSVMVPQVVVSDTLGHFMEYIPNTTVIWTPTQSPVTDDAPPQTAFPLDEGGLLLGDLPVGGQFRVRFHVEISECFVDMLYNQAWANALGWERSAEVFIPLDTAPDLVLLAQTDATGPLSSGDTVVYDLMYLNAGNNPGENAHIRVELPTFTNPRLDLSSGNWSCFDNADGVTVCELAVGTIGPQAWPSTTSFGLELSGIPTDITTLDFTAHLTDNGANGPDPAPGNNYATISLSVENSGGSGQMMSYMPWVK